MCVKPNRVYPEKGPNFSKIEVPCGKCWACRQNKANEISAKCLMELAECEWSAFLTLTYDDKRTPDKMAIKKVKIAHFQNFIRQVKKSKGTENVKYVASGEYGSRRGRAHFHCILMGSGKPPDMPPPYEEKQNMKTWPYGFVFREHVHHKNVEYVAKYITAKDHPKRIQEGNSEYRHEWVNYSKYPPLGINYVLKLADQYAAAKLHPRTFRVNPPGANEKRKYQISGASQHYFLQRLYEKWPEGREYPNKTEWMKNAYRRLIKWETQKFWDALTADQQKKLIDDSINLRVRITASTYVVNRNGKKEIVDFGPFHRFWGAHDKWLAENHAKPVTETERPPLELMLPGPFHKSAHVDGRVRNAIDFHARQKKPIKTPGDV